MTGLAGAPEALRAPPGVRRVLAVVVGVPLLLLLIVPAASAHARLESSDPAGGSQLLAGPPAVTLVFGETVGVGSGTVQVTDGAGRRVDDGSPVHPPGQDRVVRVGVRPGLGRGSYTVTWRAVSVDGHPVSGVFAFGVGVPAAAVGPVTAVDPLVGALRAVVAWVCYAAVALMFGGGLFLFWLWPAGVRDARLVRLLTVAVGSAVVGSVLMVLVQGPYVAGRGVTDLADPQLLAQTLTSGYGNALVLRVLATLLAVPVLGIWPKAPRDRDVRPSGVAEVGNALLLTASFAVTGHAAEAGIPLVSQTADAVHLAAAGTWLGGVVVLVTVFLPVADRETRDRVLPRWSRAATAAVTAVVVTGVYQAWRETGTWGAVPGTTYGRLLAAKVASVAAILLLAAVARRRVATGTWSARTTATRTTSTRTSGTGATGTGATPTGPGRVVGAEAVLGAGVLALTSVLVSTPPARSSYAPAFSTVVTGRDAEGATISIGVRIDPTRIGAETIRLSVRAGTGAGVAVTAASAVLTPVRGGPGPVRAAFRVDGVGTASASGVVLPAVGRWRLTVQVLTDPTTDYSAVTEYTVH